MNPDFKDLLLLFNARGVEYLVVGGYAVAAHGHVRATKDLDLWVRPEPANAERTLEAIIEFGAPLHGLSLTDLVQPDLIFQIGVPPVRVDIITSVQGLDFPAAWQDRVEGIFGDLRVPVLSRRHLIENKKSVGRLQDLADVENLEALGSNDTD